MDHELADLLHELRSNDGDTADVEVKSAAGGLSPDLTGTICALANLPGGGRIVLGLDEHAGFAPSGLGDPQALKQGLAGKARALHPPLTLTFRQVELDGHPVVIARVPECPPSAKPARVAATGEAWLRSWDGDHRMSEVEAQGFLRQREQPHADRATVPGATVDDLDPDLLAIWHRTVVERDPSGLGRFGGAERLVRAGILSKDGAVTTAGLLTLGVHPQQFFERFVVNLAVVDQPGVRASMTRTVTGPIPAMLEQSVEWARMAFPQHVAGDDDGAVRDRWAYPLEAFRELISNALVHRDLEDWSRGRAIEVRLLSDRLVVTNPGGLYGLTVDRLGQPDATSSRNGRLVEICRYARTATDARVVELLATGISTVRRTASAAGLPEPEFQDRGIAFTAILRSAPPEVQVTSDVVVPRRPTAAEQVVLDALREGPATIHDLVEATGKGAPALRKTLRALRARGRVTQVGGQGRGTTYHLP
ncbi:ATP-binding protein [Cellulomonas triticagri]|uniref:ArsR family transcriptional regulator n=1 Tax=Cellulomonas triticagri TaxID=2483352 RepID=A0A3M2JM24_9CELL|nr:ATP-binding protein [Cellulomonas triticagri]RMI12880.1 ArsR family transcriptional regulator [Cellulomonas triticagri]